MSSKEFLLCIFTCTFCCFYKAYFFTLELVENVSEGDLVKNRSKIEDMSTLNLLRKIEYYVFPLCPTCSKIHLISLGSYDQHVIAIFMIIKPNH